MTLHACAFYYSNHHNNLHAYWINDFYDIFYHCSDINNESKKPQDGKVRTYNSDRCGLFYHEHAYNIIL